jgi:enoyl-CoA hydratase
MPIHLDMHGSAAVILVDRAEAMNALDLATLRELTKVLRDVAVDGEVRCVVLSGAGDRAFIGGADIRYMAQVTADQATEFAALGHEAGRLLETMPKPTIAAVNGFALGGGCEMALACDIRYASSTAKFAQPEVNYGLIPGWGGTQRLARATSLGFAKELIFTGRFVDAPEALRRGLVEEVTDPVLEKALEVARTIATKSPSAVSAAKELCNRALQGSHGGNLEAECLRLGEVLIADDAREGLTAFVEKRTPAYAESES